MNLNELCSFNIKKLKGVFYMQEIFEPIFHVFYLSSVFIMSILMILAGRKENNKLLLMFGIMGFTLGFGDSFHLIPRIYALLTDGLEANAAALGFGKLVTSITMTLFYLILFRIWEVRFDVKENKSLRLFIGLLVIARVVLSLMPQNDWFNYNAPVIWGIYRNIPFTILGVLIVYLILKEAYKHNDSTFKKIGYAVIISFACYLPVVLFATTYRAVGFLMIPKTLAYLWIVYIGFKEIKKS